MSLLFGSLFAPPRHFILLLAALWFGLALAEKRAEQHNVSKDTLNNMVFLGLLGYILGGRLIYALAYFSAFVRNPLSIFSLEPELFEPIGAIMVASLVGIVYAHRQKLAFWSTLDALTPLFATLAIGLALAHLAAGTAFGSQTKLPWGVSLWGAIRHPSQIYELVASSLIFGLIWFHRTESLPGISFLTFSALTAAARLFLEAFRGDSTLIFGGLRLAQVIAWMVLAIALFTGETIRKHGVGD